MARVALLNSVCGIGSTGKICVGIGKMLEKNNIEHKIFYSYGSSSYPHSFCYSNKTYIKLQSLKSHLVGNFGFNSRSATKELLKELTEFGPDIIHIHNIHGHDCDLELLFDYIKRFNIKVIWTFHDCWPFTGYCTYYTMLECNKWMEECNNCPQRKNFSWFFDNSKKLFYRKKKMIDGLDINIVTPSEWLASEVKKSFFKSFPIKVINNGINLDVFKPIDSDFRKIYNIGDDQFIILGVSFEWEERKGIDIFISLSKLLDSDIFKIVLVGTNAKIDSILPSNIISIHRTSSQSDLAEIYSTANLLVNPTREDNYPTVNMEAIACGTPVITFNTGGSSEMIEKCTGIVMQSENIDDLITEIINVYDHSKFETSKCVDYAKKFDENIKFKEYVDFILDII